MDKLLEVNFIKEIQFPEWLSNVVVLPKKNGKWRVCVDYSNLNDTYPKETFPLPWINQIVDATTSHELLSFLDPYLGYNHILMYPPNEPKIDFITPYDMYCYKVMLFGLKNVRATYQRMISRVFEPLLGRNVEVYIDDILVKSKSKRDQRAHLREAFYLLRQHRLRLNPSKYAFAIGPGNFLGFLVSQRGIDMASGQVRAITQMQPPTMKKEIQALTGRLAALNRFISRYSNRLRPLFKALKGADIKGCGPECVEADASRRLLNWAIELSKFDIEYRPRIVIKGRVLVDFIVEVRTPIPRRLESKNGC